MAVPTLTALFWIGDDMTVAVSDHDHMAVLYLGGQYHTVVTVHPVNEGGDPSERRQADLTVFRDLGRRILIACETALADERAKNDTVSLGSPDYRPNRGEDGSGNSDGGQSPEEAADIITAAGA